MAGIVWVAVVGPVRAADIAWTNTAGGDFSTPGNWFGGSMPGPSDTPIFTNEASFPYTVTFSQSVTNKRMREGSDRVILDLSGNNYTLTNTAVSSNALVTGSAAQQLASLVVTNSGSGGITNVLDVWGAHWIGYDGASGKGTGSVVIAGANVNMDRTSSVNQWTTMGSNSALTVRGGARYCSGLTQRLENYGGVLRVEGNRSRWVVKFHNAYAGSVEIITNNALMVCTNGGIITIWPTARLTFDAGAKYCGLEDGTASGGRGEAVDGTMEILGGSSCDFGTRVQVGTTAGSAGQLIVSGTGSTLVVQSSASQGFQGVFAGGINNVGPVSTGAVTVANGGKIQGEVDLFPLGTLSGNGLVDVGAGGFNNGGLVKPGWPLAGTLTVTNGAFKMSYSNETTHVVYPGTIQFELGGTNAGSSSKLAVYGTLTLGGTCTVSLVNGFVPKDGDLFDLLDWTNRIGAFGTVNLPSLPKGYWITNDLYTTGTIVARVPASGAMVLIR